MVHTGSAPLNDYYYSLTEQGRERRQTFRDACAYTGAAPVPLTDYITSVEAQTIRAEAPKRTRLEKAFADISIDPNLFDSLGPAVNSGAGMFLYGAPGNGKSTLGPAHHGLLRPADLDSADADRRRPDHQAVRRRSITMRSRIGNRAS